VSGYGLDDRAIEVRSPAEARDFSSNLCAQTGSGAHSASLMAGNRCYYALQNVLKSKTLSRKAKLNVYKTIIRPVVIYGSETWTLTKKEMSH
jgi:hypothetical protein